MVALFRDKAVGPQEVPGQSGCEVLHSGKFTISVKFRRRNNRSYAASSFCLSCVGCIDWELASSACREEQT